MTNKMTSKNDKCEIAIKNNLKTHVMRYKPSKAPLTKPITNIVCLLVLQRQTRQKLNYKCWLYCN